MTVPTANNPVQPGADNRKVVRGLVIGVVTLAVLLSAALAYITATDIAPRIKQHQTSTAITQDAYRNWPAAGTEPAFPGEHLPTAQGIIALTCRDGKVHIDENMLVDSSLREGAAPSWYVNLYVDYNQSNNAGHCEVRFAPLFPAVKLYKLTLLEDGSGWAAQSNSLSFDGLDSLSVKKDGQDIGLVLVNFGDERVKPGIQIKLGDNGIPAPGRELLKS